MTQCDRILDYLERNGSITDLEARDLSIHRLGARIYDLRAAGYNITKETKTGRNEYGKYVYAKYRLEN